jgi:hypothetical protein
VIKTAYPLSLRSAPGEKWEYCNVGYFETTRLLGPIVRRGGLSPSLHPASRSATLAFLHPKYYRLIISRSKHPPQRIIPIIDY